MHAKLKILSALIIILLLLMFPMQGKDKAIKSLHFAISLPHTFEITYDPSQGNYINLQPLFHSCYATLFKLDEHLRPQPSFLLEEVKTNGKSVTFKLKKESRFSDGSDITSEDVIQSIEAGMKNTAYTNSVYKLIEGGDELFQGKTSHCSGIKIIDYKQFQIQLVEENVELSNYLTSVIMSILPVNRNNRNGKMLFSGPFQVVKQEQKRNQIIFTLERNPWYIGEKPKLDILFIHIYREDEEFEKVIREGEPDLFLYNNRLQMPVSTYKYNYFKAPIFGGFYFIPNPQNGPFKDKRLRTFFKYFVRSRDIVLNEHWVLTTPLSLVLPYSLTGYFIFNPIPEQDFKPYTPLHKVIIKCVNPRFGMREELFTLLKKKLKKYNISLDLRWDTINNIHDMEKKGTVDLTTLYYISDVPLSVYFYETLFIPGHELNLFAYKVPEALELLDTYRKENDEMKKLKILSRLEEIAQEEAILIPLLNPLSLLGYKNRVKNVAIDKLLIINFEAIDVKN